MDDNVLKAVLEAVPEPFFVFDEDGYYVNILGGVDREKYHDGQHLIGRRIHEVIELDLADLFLEQIRKALQQRQPITYVYQLAAADVKGSEELPGPAGKLWFEAHISPIATAPGQPRMVVWIAFNITALQRTLLEKQALITDLQRAAGEIRTLRGILPICSHCKKIRDDNGYWKQLEDYISTRTEADFSHGICDVCYKKHYEQ